MVKTFGIVAHSFEGGALCFLTACREGAAHLGPHLHPSIVMSAIPMGLSMAGWESGDHSLVAEHLAQGVRQVAQAGAEFYVCPDNTAHLVLEEIATELPIPGLHIGEVVCAEIAHHGWNRVGLLGTRWTMTGPVYERLLKGRGVERLIPDEPMRERVNAAIFEELCQGVIRQQTVNLILDAAEELRARGAECVVLGCTELPLVVTHKNAPLPVLDSTRLLARFAVREALSERRIGIDAGWLSTDRVDSC